jgi:hypothetical protein
VNDRIFGLCVAVLGGCSVLGLLAVVLLAVVSGHVPQELVVGTASCLCALAAITPNGQQRKQ